MLSRFLKYHLLFLLSLFLFSLSVSAQEDTSKKSLPDSALYMIDSKEATKLQVEKLDKGLIKSVDVWKGEKAIEKFGDKGRNGVIVVTTKAPVHIDDDDIVFTKVEVPAAFPGGIDGWRMYLERNLRYPKAAQKRNTQGAVRVQMTVKKDGSVTDVAVLNDPGDGLGDESKRVVLKGPKWIPASEGGISVNYKFVQTITFQLQ